MEAYSPDCHTAEMAAAAVLDTVLSHCVEELYERYLDAQVIPFSLEMVLGQLASGLEIIYQRRDVGESQEWMGDPEAVPNPSDSWARGHISIRKGVRKHRNEDEDTSKLSRWSRKSSSVGSFVMPVLERPQIYTLEWALEQPDPLTDQLRENKEKELLQQKADEERDRLRRQQREEEVRRVERMAFELKKSHFTYDYDGKILIVKPRPLPSPSMVHFSLPAIPEPPSKPKRLATPRRPVQVLKKTPVSELQFVKSLHTAPNVMDVLKMSPGVTAYESNRAKRGQDPPGKTMTWEEYRRLSAADRGEALQPAKESQHCHQSTLRKRVLSEIPDSDRDEELPMYASLPNLVAADNLSEVDKFNIEILKSQDWGLNIAALAPHSVLALPAKPSPEALQKTHGLKSKLPRDRPFVDRKLEKKHFPPPRFGKTMGHGDVDPVFSHKI